MKIAVVILNWNGKALLEQFLPSVVKYSREADIYIADNASTDDSITFISYTYPQIKIIQNAENGGYAKGYNDALQHVDADVYCLLNSDVAVTKNWLSPIMEAYRNYPETAIIQPKILDFKNQTYFEYAGAAGGFIDKYGYPYCRGRIFDTIEEDHGQYNDIAKIFWASGACLFIRSSVFKTLRGFDEFFFAHMEEIDLCWRAKNLNYQNIYVGTSTVYHVGGATLNNTSPKKTYLNFRNNLFILVKNAPGHLFTLVFTRLVLDGVAGLKFVFNFKPKHTLAILRAHFAFYKHLNALLNQRKTLQQKSIYYSEKSIVWSYFVKKRRYFNSL